MQQIADVIGEGAALKLVRELPRVYSKQHPAGEPVLYVPKLLTPSHRLVVILGQDLAAKLAWHFRGELLFLGTCAGRRRAARNARIVRALPDPSRAKVAEVAAREGLEARTVWRILAKARAQADIPPKEPRAPAPDHACKSTTAAAA